VSKLQYLEPLTRFGDMNAKVDISLKYASNMHLYYRVLAGVTQQVKLNGIENSIYP